MVDGEASLATFYNDLNASLAETCRILQMGARDRRNPAHTPVVATIDRQGAPAQRVMILRDVSWAERRLRFHTDARSVKVTELESISAASVLIYDPVQKIQIRLSGAAIIETDGRLADLAWNNSTLFARRCYMANAPSGDKALEPTSGLPKEIEGQKPTEEQIETARSNFAALKFVYDKIDWLYLANSGHRRAGWTWDEHSAGWCGSWLIP